MALDYDGSGDFLSIADNVPLSITGALSLSSWINTDDATPPTNARGIVGKFIGSGNQRSYVLALTVNGAISLTVSSSGASAQNIAATTANGDIANAGQWYHVAAVYVPSTSMTIYIDGAVEGSNETSIPAAIFDGTAPFYIGNQFQAATGFEFIGLLAESAVWNASLSADEVASLAKGLSPIRVRPDNLVTYVPAVREVRDLVGGFDITTNGTPAAVPHPRIIYPRRASHLFTPEAEAPVDDGFGIFLSSPNLLSRNVMIGY